MEGIEFKTRTNAHKKSSQNVGTFGSLGGTPKIVVLSPTLRKGVILI